MKIGILTFHRSINYGAFMQTYALSHEIMRRYGDVVEVIDFEKLSKHLGYQMKMKGFRHKILNGNSYEIQYRRFQDDLRLLPLSTPPLITNDYEVVLDYINNRYDIVIVGSDAVWAYNKGLGLQNPYWLFGDKLKCIKLSYAASAHSLNIDSVTDDEKDYIAECLRSFTYIGVRDVTTLNLVKNCNEHLDVHMNCDPTVLLAKPDRENGLRILRDNFGITPKKKIISIMLGRKTPLLNVAMNHLGKKDYQYVCLFRRLHWSERFKFGSPRFLYNLSPYEWYQIFSCMDFNMTTFFHGTLLALKSGVPTFSFDGTAMGINYVSKIKQLLTDLTLSDYLYNNTSQSVESELNFIDVLDYTIKNRDAVSKKIDDVMALERQKSDSFFAVLDTILKKNYQK